MPEALAEQARASSFSVGLVLHTSESDYARQQVAGISATLAAYGAQITGVVDCHYRVDTQLDALRQMSALRPDAVISIPVDNALTAKAHLDIARDGIKLVLMDNTPIGMRAGKDYSTLVSSDNFGNGQVAAWILGEHVPHWGVVAIVAFGVDYYATNEREIGFRKWMRENRPDVTLKRVQFTELEAAGEVVLEFLGSNHDVNALFVAWDEPAMAIARALRAAGRTLPVTSMDLGNDIALEIARGDIVKGLGAQRPYDLGRAEAQAVILALTGGEVPAWVALPAFPVTRANILTAYQAVWHRPAPEGIQAHLRGRL
ncbi:MAG TPA: substrate-binding domain-containing protein [Candidatus Limnocylindrales bacterium]|nr:substrate-binding domain-containing protein [Candidatus Limnocylindrales bacterium]